MSITYLLKWLRIRLCCVKVGQHVCNKLEKQCLCYTYVPLESVLCKHGSSWLSHYQRRHLTARGCKTNKNNRLVCYNKFISNFTNIQSKKYLLRATKLMSKWLCHRGPRGYLEMPKSRFGSARPNKHTSRSSGLSERGSLRSTSTLTLLISACRKQHCKPIFDFSSS